MKKIKFLILVVCLIICACSLLTFGACTQNRNDSNDSSSTKFITFGEYPQTIMAKNVKITGGPNDKGYYKGSDGNWYAKGVGILSGADSD